MSKNQTTVDMRKGPLLKQIIIFTIPVLLSGLFQQLFHIADLLVVGNFSGSNALASVGATSSLTNMLTNFFIGFSMGSGVVSSHYYGADDDDNLKKVVNTAFISSIFIGFLLVFIGLFFTKPILILMNTPKDIIEGSALYMKILFFGMPANMIFNFLNSISRAVGDSKRPMKYLIISGFLNVILNLIFVLVFKMSVDGVAYATIISQYLSAFLMIIKFLKSPEPVKLNIKKLIFDSKIFRKIMKIGLPAGIQSTAVSLSNVFIQSAINNFGAAAVSGYTAGNNIGSFIYLAMNSLYQTTLTLVAQNYGYGDFERIKKGIKLCLICVIIVGLIVCCSGVIFKNFLLRIYTSDSNALQAGYVYYNIVVATYFMCGIMEVLTGALRGIGKSFESMIIIVLTMSVFRIIWNFTVFQWYTTLECVFIAYPISWIMAITILSLILKRGIKSTEQMYMLSKH